MTFYAPWRSLFLMLILSITSCATTTPPSTTTDPSSSTSSPASAPSTQSDKPLVVATHSVLCDLTKQIAQDTINLQCLIPAGSDPHIYQPTPAARQAIESAQLVLYGGYDFEPSLIKVVTASSTTAPKVAVSELAVPQPLMGEQEHHEPGATGIEHAEDKDPVDVDKAKDQDHAHVQSDQATGAAGEETADPHVWHNAKNGIKMAEVIRDKLSQINPSKADLYQNNAQKVTTELTQIDRWITAQVATIPATARKLVTTHDALGYYADAYQIPVETALVGLSTEEAPTATRVKELVEEVKAAQVPMVFAEVSASSKLIETVAKEAQVKLSGQELFADSLGEAGSPADTYQKMLVANTKAIVEGLGGTFTLFTMK
jgi:manganese/iron transport system substrate-binding protein